MQRQDFRYQLPPELIAEKPAAQRRDSRLLVLEGESGQLQDKHFKDLLDYVQPGDLMVFNDTKVIPARLFGKKETGGQLEILIERLLDEHRVLAHVRASKSPKPGSKIILENQHALTMVQRCGNLFELDFGAEPALEMLEAIGHMPLPPYIEREDQDSDKERYQTVYGKHPGAVAAPTAGLHFDDAMLQSLNEKGIETAFVTLHVGAGTFQPVRVDNIQEHVMHSEVMQVSEAVCEKVRATKLRGGRVIAVGTTSVRCLETAAKSGEIKSYQGETDIFIFPGYQFQLVDVLITNFHLPESTLLMLVSAFVGYQQTMKAYNHAVKERYRFFSYGDAMLITRNPKATEDRP